MTPEKVAEVQKYGREPISLHTPLGEDGDSEFGDLIEDSEAVLPADAVSFTLLQEQLHSVLDTLSEREAGVVSMRFGLTDGQPKTLDEIAQVYGVTRERIRQLESKTMSKLRHPSRSELLRHFLLDSGDTRENGQARPSIAQEAARRWRNEAAERMWRSILGSHPRQLPIGQRGPLPLLNELATQPGVLYIANRDSGQITACVASCLDRAVADVRTAALLPRYQVIWVPGEREILRRTSPMLQAPPSALRSGKPKTITHESDWLSVIHEAGIYRIHLVDQDGNSCIYIGRSQDLAVRPRHHEKTRGRTWGSGPNALVRIELLPAKAPSRAIWTVTDLDDAEERLIERARTRQREGGPTVLNLTGGRNGPPSRPQSALVVWTPPETEALSVA
jgi:DNA-binding CsgD family transcriptional regulator